MRREERREERGIGGCKEGSRQGGVPLYITNHTQ